MGHIVHNVIHLFEGIFAAGAVFGIVLDEIVSTVVRRIRRRRARKYTTVTGA